MFDNTVKAQYERNAALAQKLNSDGLGPDDVQIIMDEHPEGEDRGGIVPWVHSDNAKVYWDHNEDAWSPV